MKLIYERTIFIPGVLRFFVGPQRIRRVTAPAHRRLPGITGRYSECLIVVTALVRLVGWPRIALVVL
jgi:hypothetical protein